MVTFGAGGYGVLAVLYALLALLLLTAWRGRRVGGYLIIACLSTMIWSGLLAWETLRGSASIEVLFFSDTLKAGAWLAFLAQISPARFLRYVAHGAWLLVLLAGSWVVGSNMLLGTVGSLEPVFNYGGLGLSLAGLILLEQLYRNSPERARSSLKALVIGLGGMFAFDLFLFSQAVLFQQIDEATLLARGAVNILFVPVIALAVRRNPLWDLNIFVSRQVVFYTTTLVAVGLYLLLMSIGGYLLLLVGGSWGAVARTVFLMGAGLVLITLLASGRVRTRVRVFLSKHFFQNKYDYREEWLRLVETLAEFEDSSTRQVVIKALAQIVESPSGLLWTQRAGGDAYKLAAAFREADSAPDLAVDCDLIRFIMRDGWIVDVAELRNYPQRYEGLVLPDWLAAKRNAWLIVPLITRDSIVGLILLTSPPVTRELNYEDRDLLKTVGNHIAVHLAQEQSENLLSEAKQFEAFNRLTAFLMHDLKNLIAQQSLIIENAERHKRNPEFVDDALETIANGVTRMRRVIEHLRQTSVSQPVEKIELVKLVLQVVSGCEDREPVPQAAVSDGQIWIRGDRDRLRMALSHAIRNAQEATPDDGTVEVRLGHEDGVARIEIADSGAGMDAEFVRERLFKPFDSTKGTQGVGIGAYQIQETVRLAGGTVSVNSERGKGTTMVWRLPSGGEKV
jgi:putative PEP-CTERM system histidine kinase